MTTPTEWKKLVKLKPSLLSLYSHARNIRRGRWFDIRGKQVKPFCINKVYYEEFEPEIEGIAKELNQPALAFDLASYKILHALPCCYECGCNSHLLGRECEEYYQKIARDYYDLRDPRIKRAEFSDIRGTLKFKRTAETIIASQSGKCYYCSYPLTQLGNTHFDHIIPLTRGGSNKVANITIACSVCNIAKGSDIYDYKYEIDPRDAHVFGRLTRSKFECITQETIIKRR